jgi:hypothetical protein
VRPDETPDFITSEKYFSWNEVSGGKQMNVSFAPEFTQGADEFERLVSSVEGYIFVTGRLEYTTFFGEKFFSEFEFFGRTDRNHLQDTDDGGDEVSHSAKLSRSSRGLPTLERIH